MDLLANEGKNIKREVNGQIYERYALKTRFVNIGDDYVEIVKEYASPYVKEGDFISISEKIIALCQKRIVYRDQIHPGFWAKLLCKFVAVTPAGPGAGTPHKMQLIIMQCGLPRVLFAAFCSAVTKLFGKKGVFYKICGHEVEGIDGLIDYDISFTEYVNYGILNPVNPAEVCNEIKEKLGITCMIVDACDISVEILGKSKDLLIEDETLAEIIRDNPAGQDDQCTPLILIRKSTSDDSGDNNDKDNESIDESEKEAVDKNDINIEEKEIKVNETTEEPDEVKIIEEAESIDIKDNEVDTAEINEVTETSDESVKDNLVEENESAK